MPQKPQIVQNDTFCLITFYPSIRFSETLPKRGDSCYEPQLVPPTPAKLWFASPRGLLGLKTPHFGGFYEPFSRNVIMYVFIVVFYDAEFKFTSPNTWNLIVYPFWDVFRVSWGLLGLKIPPKCQFLPKKRPFWCTYFDWFAQLFQNLGKICSYLYAV